MLKPLAAIAAFTALSAQTALACSCAPCGTPPLQSAEIDAAFVGELLSVRRADLYGDTASDAHTLILVYSVIESLKGNLESHVTVRTPSEIGGCGTFFTFVELEAVAVRLTKDGNYETDLCLQTCHASDPNNHSSVLMDSVPILEAHPRD